MQDERKVTHLEQITHQLYGLVAEIRIAGFSTASSLLEEFTRDFEKSVDE